MAISANEKISFSTKSMVMFLSGMVILPLSSWFIYKAIVFNFWNHLNEKMLVEMMTPDLTSLIYCCQGLFVIAYVIFGSLPWGIRGQKWWIRLPMFVLFYLFCLMVYWWI